VLERGFDEALVAALEAMNPDLIATPEAMADALEVAGRVGRWAATRGDERAAVRSRAEELARRALGRLVAYAQSDKSITQDHWAALDHAVLWAPAKEAAVLGAWSTGRGCPPEGAPSLTTALLGLDAEPPPAAG